jgi:hypothetical protein
VRITSTVTLANMGASLAWKLLSIYVYLM